MNKQVPLDHEIASLLERYVTAVDARDAEAFRCCFGERITVDNAGTPTLEISGDEWTAQAMRALGVFVRTAHRISNVEVDIDGHVAHCRADVEARHWNADVELVVWARYSHRLIRSEEGWRIQHFVMQVIETKAEPIRS